MWRAGIERHRDVRLATFNGAVYEAGRQMKTRILFSMALVAVLFVFWLIMSKPACLAGETASLGPRLEWTCLPR
jgi:hypothetical protein